MRRQVVDEAALTEADWSGPNKLSKRERLRLVAVEVPIEVAVQIEAVVAAAVSAVVETVADQVVVEVVE